MKRTAQDDLTALREAAAFAALPERGFLRISGSDASRWLNGMVTNSIQALAPGQGCYNFLLSAQGRIQADCTIYREAGGLSAVKAATPIAEPSLPEFLLSTSAAQRDAIQQQLDRFIIMDDVELTPAYTDESSLLLLGPEAPQRLASLKLPALDPLRIAHVSTPHGPILMLTPSATEAAVPRFELRAPEGILAALRDDMRAAGLPEVSAAALEQLRILEATPSFGKDIGDRDLPQETAQAHALHFAKGCYLGQEIVERIRSRGAVHRTFLRFRLQPDDAPAGSEGSGPTEAEALPALPAPLQAGGKPAGELTSAAFVPLPEGPALFGLGYARREIVESGQTLTYPGGAAVPAPLHVKK